jgi:hypothetical protein
LPGGGCPRQRDDLKKQLKTLPQESQRSFNNRYGCRLPSRRQRDDKPVTYATMLVRYCIGICHLPSTTLFRCSLTRMPKTRQQSPT